jgi:hypothetical protein
MSELDDEEEDDSTIDFVCGDSNESDCALSQQNNL